MMEDVDKRSLTTTRLSRESFLTRQRRRRMGINKDAFLTWKHHAALMPSSQGPGSSRVVRRKNCPIERLSYFLRKLSLLSKGVSLLYRVADGERSES